MYKRQHIVLLFDLVGDWFSISHLDSLAETLDQLIAGAKKESELTFIAGAQTFGGAKTLAALEAAFNKRFGLSAKIRFAAGPEMNAMAARVITEQKSGSKTSTDLYHGSQSHFALLHKEKALEQVDWSGVFPWICQTHGNFSQRRSAGFHLASRHHL